MDVDGTIDITTLPTRKKPRRKRTAFLEREARELAEASTLQTAGLLCGSGADHSEEWWGDEWQGNEVPAVAADAADAAAATDGQRAATAMEAPQTIDLTCDSADVHSEEGPGDEVPAVAADAADAAAAADGNGQRAATAMEAAQVQSAPQAWGSDTHVPADVFEPEDSQAAPGAAATTASHPPDVMWDTWDGRDDTCTRDDEWARWRSAQQQHDHQPQQMQQPQQEHRQQFEHGEGGQWQWCESEQNLPSQPLQHLPEHAMWRQDQSSPLPDHSHHSHSPFNLCRVRGHSCMVNVGVVCANCTFLPQAVEHQISGSVASLGSGGRAVEEVPEGSLRSAGPRGGAIARLRRQGKRQHLGLSQVNWEQLDIYARVAASRAGGVFLTEQEYAEFVAIMHGHGQSKP